MDLLGCYAAPRAAGRCEQPRFKPTVTAPCGELAQGASFHRSSVVPAGNARVSEGGRTLGWMVGGGVAVRARSDVHDVGP